MSLYEIESGQPASNGTKAQLLKEAGSYQYVARKRLGCVERASLMIKLLY